MSTKMVGEIKQYTCVTVQCTLGMNQDDGQVMEKQQQHLSFVYKWSHNQRIASQLRTRAGKNSYQNLI